MKSTVKILFCLLEISTLWASYFHEQTSKNQTIFLKDQIVFFCFLIAEQYLFLFLFTVNYADKFCRSSLISTQLIIFQLNRRSGL